MQSFRARSLYKESIVYGFTWQFVERIYYAWPYLYFNTVRTCKK